MANSPSTSEPDAAAFSPFHEDSEIWRNLKRAIASSSGFQRWQLERDFQNPQHNLSLDQLVSLYLRETLETLAY